MIDINTKNKILNIFEGSFDDIKKDLLQLEENIKNNEKLSLKSRSEILDSTYILETAVYRAVIYNMRYELKCMKKQLEILNTTLNRMVKKSNHEFFSIMNYKIFALLTFTINYC